MFGRSDMGIKQIIDSTRVPVKIWTDNIEQAALEQAMALANVMPVASHVALMPDVHLGKGMPIGGVLPLRNAVSPNCVGVDIGCGVLAVKTSLKSVERRVLGRIFREIRKRIPVGIRGRRKNGQMAEWSGFDSVPDIPAVKKELKNARSQLGTLGAGNHFIEIQKGDDGHIWWMIHSGSRNPGFRIADFYHKLALQRGIVPEGRKQLAYFDIDSPEGREYFAAMNFCLGFALANRRVMSRDVRDAFALWLDFQVLDEINIHHNYAARYVLANGEEVILHRKGATEATVDTVGIVPGSQGSSSFIVRGRGEPESFCSCSHGAGRRLSRTMAKKLLDVDKCVAAMKRMGLECDKNRFPLDEAMEAYKDIMQVMADQDDLVETVAELRPYKYPAIKG